MDPDDKTLDIAARIADGSAIDWTATDAASSPDERALLHELHTIADIATLHRAPRDWPSDTSAEGPAAWGSLTLLSAVGKGRFGEVYVAWDARLQRRVALKLLRLSSPSLSSPTRAIEEARLLARVRHPNVLAVYGAEYLNDQVGIWTEFIEGHTLESILTERGPFDPDEVMAIGRDLCAALTAVHAAGLLHRDIKAQNVMRETSGRIVLMDFGTVHDLAVSPARGGDMTGTPLYLAPEIFLGAPPTVASDIYALAVLLFHLLTAEFPIASQSQEEVRRAHVEGRARPLRDVRPDLPDALIDAVERGLASDPARRYIGAEAFASALMSADPRNAVYQPLGAVAPASAPL